MKNFIINNEWNTLLKREHKGSRLKEIRETVIAAANDPIKCEQFINSRKGSACFLCISQAIGSGIIVDEELAIAVDIISDKYFASLTDLER